MRRIIPLLLLSLNVHASGASTLVKRSPCAADLASTAGVADDVHELDTSLLNQFYWSRGRTCCGIDDAWIGRPIDAGVGHGGDVSIHLYRFANGSLGMNLQFNLADAAEVQHFKILMHDVRYAALGVGISEYHSPTSRPGDVTIKFLGGGGADYRFGVALTLRILIARRAGRPVSEGFDAPARMH